MAPPPAQSFRGGFPGAPPSMGYAPQMGYPQPNMAGYTQPNLVPIHMPVPPVVQEQHTHYETNGSDVSIFDIQQTPNSQVMEVSVRVLDSTGAFVKQTFFSRIGSHAAAGASFNTVTDTLYNLLNNTFWVMESKIKEQQLRRAFQAVGAKTPTAVGSAFISDIARKALNGAQLQDFSLGSLGVFFGFGMVSANTVANTELVYKVLQRCAMVSLFGVIFSGADDETLPTEEVTEDVVEPAEENVPPAKEQPADKTNPVTENTQAVAESAPVTQVQAISPSRVATSKSTPWADVPTDTAPWDAPLSKIVQESEPKETISAPERPVAEEPVKEPDVTNDARCETNQPKAQEAAPVQTTPPKPGPKSSPRNMWGAQKLTLAQRLAQNSGKAAPATRPTVRRTSQNKPTSSQGEQTAPSTADKKQSGKKRDRGTAPRTRAVPAQPRKPKVVKKDKDGFQTISRQKQLQPERFKERKFIVKQVNNAITRNMRQDDEKLVWISYDGGQNKLVPRCIRPIRWEAKKDNNRSVFVANTMTGRGRLTNNDVYFAIGKVRELRETKFSVELPKDDETGSTGDR